MAKILPCLDYGETKLLVLLQIVSSPFFKSKVKNLQTTNIGRWWREVKSLSGVSASEGQWFRQLVDGQTIDSIDTLC